MSVKTQSRLDAFQQTMPFPEFGITIDLDDLYTDILALMDEIRRQRKQGKQ